MSVKKIVHLPGGVKTPLDDLEVTRLTVCDSCGLAADEGQEFIVLYVSFMPQRESHGEGCCDRHAHLCGRAGCQVSDLARRFEALWPLPDDAPPVVAPQCARGDHSGCYDNDTGHPCECCLNAHRLPLPAVTP